MTNVKWRQGADMAKTEQERQAENDFIARQFLETVKARAERMHISEMESLASTVYILVIDFFESRRIGDSTFVGEFDSRRGRNKKTE